jgi:cation diffusion facilitator family transporter
MITAQRELSAPHSHIFLGENHERSEKRTFAVIWLCAAMMAAEIVGGLLFGSIALVADGLHMSTHAGALLLAALAYRYARRHADDRRFTFGAGKVGDLAGFASAIVLAMIAILIGYEAIGRFFSPVPINFAEAIPIAVLGLLVNLASVWLLGAGYDHGHVHGHSHPHSHSHDHGPGSAGHRHHDELRRISTPAGAVVLEIFEDGVPPRFRLSFEQAAPRADAVSIETRRPDGTRQSFAFVQRAGFLESRDEIPEPHAFSAELHIGGDSYQLLFEESGSVEKVVARDNNMRAAVVHVVADATVSLLVIVGLILARAFDWAWIDPLVGVVGALVIASWSYGLIRDTGAILLDMSPDRDMETRLREAVEREGDKVADLHLWRLGPGHLGAIVSVETAQRHDLDYYRGRLARFRGLSHVTVEISKAA